VSKRAPRVTKKEKKAANAATGGGGGGGHNHNEHIHCTTCGKHLDVHEFDAPATALWVKCQHGSSFPSCTVCLDQTKARLAEHDRTGKPVETAHAWH
jgi:hypothetical protein